MSPARRFVSVRLVAVLATTALSSGVAAQQSTSPPTSQQQSSTPATAAAWLETGLAHARANRLDDAASAFLSAVAAGESSGDIVSRVTALRELGIVRLRQQRVKDALEVLRSARPLAEAQPGTRRLLGLVQQSLAAAEITVENFAAAREHAQAAIDVLSSVDAGDLELSRAYQFLGICYERTGDPASAHTALTRAVEIARARAPGTDWEARPLNELGINAKNRGDLAAAERHYLDVLAILEQSQPASLAAANVLNNLGVVADLRADFDRAESYQKRALALREKLDPSRRSVFGSLNNLGIIAAKRGDLTAAESWFRRALELGKQLFPGTLSEADALGNLALILKDMPGRRAEAVPLQEQALALRQTHAPNGLRVALSLGALADVVEAEGANARAETLYRDALAIHERLAPGSLGEASSLHALGRLARRRGDPAAAKELYLRAVEAFEGQSRRLGGTPEVQSGFRAGHRPIYGDAIELLVETGDAAAAFALYERSRARVLIDLLAQRRALLDVDVPETLIAERRRVDGDFDRLQAQLAAVRADDGEAIERLHAQLRDLRAQQVDVADRVRRAAPRTAALRYPAPVDLAGAQAALDDGTLAVAYHVGERQTVAFAAGRDEFRAVVLQERQQDLRRDVEQWRRLAARGRTSPDDVEPLRELSAALYDRLLRPLASSLSRHDRLVIIGDGPLHLLPFAALVERRENGASRYLIESKTLRHIVSFTAATQAAEMRPPARQHRLQLLAFGAPDYANASEPLAPLPGADDEARAVATLFGDGGEAVLGADATEARIKSTAGDARYLHLAVHGVLNETFPMNSALAFAAPGAANAAENGWLQAWEVMDQVRLDADLVVLSACDTGIGGSSGGDGLLGLSRAFHFAGARAVIASLWPIADAATPQLMRRFYTALRDGASHADALAAAQRDALTRTASRHPYFWAPFVLNGAAR